MSRQGYWGDNLSLFCLAHVLQRPIFIYRQGETPQALVPPILRPEAAPVTLWLDESRPGLEHYSPLTTAPPARKRLLSKQHDPCPPASAPCVRQLPPRAAKTEVRQKSTQDVLPMPRRCVLDSNRIEAGRSLRRRGATAADIGSICKLSVRSVHTICKDVPLKRPATKTNYFTAENHAFALKLLAQGRTHKHVQLRLGCAKSTLQKLLKLQGRLPSAAEGASAASSTADSLPQDLAEWFKEFSKASFPKRFSLVTPLPSPTFGLPDDFLLERAWMRTGSWTSCPRCLQMFPAGLLLPLWPLKAKILCFCKSTSCAALKPLPQKPSLAPRREHWPDLCFALSADDWNELVLADLKVDYKSVRGGRSPVLSKQKTGVVRAVWRRSCPAPQHAHTRALLKYLLEHHKAYKKYFDFLQRLLSKGAERSFPTAQLLLGMPGIEVAFRPWLFPQDPCAEHVLALQMPHPKQACPSSPLLPLALCRMPCWIRTCARDFLLLVC